MRMAIHHETTYRYTTPASYSVQYLRLTPRTSTRQKVLSWKIDCPGLMTEWVDAFGNLAHVLVIDRPHEDIRIQARGEIETNEPPKEGEEVGPQAPELYLRPTRLTQPSVSLARFADGFRELLEADRAAGLEKLMHAVRETVDYRSGITHAATPAADAFADKAGVCQDHAHIFVTCCRRLGIPARYVSGYLGANAGRMASHAWAQAWVDDGWHGYDVSNDITNLDRHVQVAVGLDYLDACPVRGMRRGGFGESLEVEVLVNQASQAQAKETPAERGARQALQQQQQQQ